GRPRRTVEAYVHDDHDLELYGDTVRLEFVDFQRPTLKFDSAEALVEHMHLDVEVTRRTLGAGTVGAAPTGCDAERAAITAEESDSAPPAAASAPARASRGVPARPESPGQKDPERRATTQESHGLRHRHQAGDHQGVRDHRGRHRLARGPGRAPDPPHQVPDRAPEDPQARPPHS